MVSPDDQAPGVLQVHEGEDGETHLEIPCRDGSRVPVSGLYGADGNPISSSESHPSAFAKITDAQRLTEALGPGVTRDGMLDDDGGTLDVGDSDDDLESSAHYEGPPSATLTVLEDGDTEDAFPDSDEKNDGPVVDVPRQRDYQWRLKKGDNSFKEMYGLTPESIGEGINFLMDEEVLHSIFGKDFTRFTNNDVRNLFLKIEFAQSGLEAYLRELDERSQAGGEDGAAAESMLCHLEDSGLHEKLLAMRGFSRELRLCYENGCVLRNKDQAVRIFKKHLYRAHGVSITASKNQDEQIAHLKAGNSSEHAQKIARKLDGDASELDMSFRSVGGRDMYQWAKEALPDKAYAALDNQKRFRKGLKYVSKPVRVVTSIIPFSPLHRVIPGYANGFLKDKWSDRDDKDMMVPGFARPKESASRYNKGFWSFKWCADFMFPAPGIKLNGKNGGSIKIPYVSAEALEWAKENPEKAEGKKWYREARATCMDFVDSLVELGRARTPGDAFNFTGDPNLQDQMMLAVKMRAVATNEVFFINVNGSPVRVGPEPPISKLDPNTPEGQLFNDIKNRTNDIYAMQDHYDTLRTEFVMKGRSYTESMMKKHNRPKFDIQQEEVKLLELSGHHEKAARSPGMRSR